MVPIDPGDCHKFGLAGVVVDRRKNQLTSSLGEGGVPKNLHWKPPAALLDVPNTIEAHLFHLQRRLDGREVGIGGDEGSDVSPRMHQLQKNPRPLSGFIGGNVLIVVFVGSGGGDRLLLGRSLDDLQSEHNPRHDVSKILDLAAVVGLALDRGVMGDPCIDVGPSDAIPTNHGLVSLEMATGDEHLRAILVDVGDKVVNQIQWYCSEDMPCGFSGG